LLIEWTDDRQARPEDGAYGDQPAVLSGLAVVIQAAGQPVCAIYGPTAGGHVSGFVYDPGYGVRGRVHHGQLHRAAWMLHDNDVYHAQLRHVPHVPVGHTNARVRGRLRGGVCVVCRVHMHWFAHSRESTVAVWTGSPR